MAIALAAVGGGGCGVVVVVVMMCVWWAVHAWWWDVKYSWLRAAGELRLPGGSMGWPLLGESLHFCLPNTSLLKPGLFFDQRQARYGCLFKSHLFGEPVVVSTSATINKFVLQKEGVLFRSAYPSPFLRLMGESSLITLHGHLHEKLRKHIMRVTSAIMLPQYIREIEECTLAYISTWEHVPVIFFHKEACKMKFDFLAKRLISLGTKDVEVQVLMEHFEKVFVALTSLPVNIHGTSFNIALKSREKIVNILESIIERRLHARTESQSDVHPRMDFLDMILDAEIHDKEITRSRSLDLLFGLIFGAYETTATTLTFAMMLLHKHQNVMDNLMVEHMDIQRKIGSTNKGLTWEDYKSMAYTKHVVYETLRLANTAPYVYREALQDVEIDGYIIPKGWKVITSFNSVHVDPELYKEPLTFNPSRWQNGSNLKKSFMPFGGGSRICLGNELALLQICIFLYHFLTKYNWREVGEETIIKMPHLTFKHGYPINVTRKPK